MYSIILGKAEQELPRIANGSVQMVYIDPPFNTGKEQRRTTISAYEDASSSRVGFGGRTYSTDIEDEMSYRDNYTDYLGFLMPIVEQCHRILGITGTFYIHLDWREVHYVKVALDKLFGRQQFLNEIIWAYDYGAKSKRKWPTKHDTILVYVKDSSLYYYNNSEVDREPYMAPGLVTPEKVERGKLPTDVWWHTIVPTNGYEKTGYPNQKPEGIIRRMIQASTQRGDTVLDCFAGSGTTGAVAHKLGRYAILIDSNPEACIVMRDRLGSEFSYIERG